MSALNFIFVIIASLLLLAGFVLMVTPIPGATIMIAAGLTLLIYASPKARLCIQWIRSRAQWFNKLFSWLEDKVGMRIHIIGNTLKDTRPLKYTIGEGLSHSEYVKEKLAEKNKLKESDIP